MTNEESARKEGRKGWRVEIFDSFEDTQEADRKANLALTGIERIRILTATSTPKCDGPQPPFPSTFEILDGPSR